MIIGGIASIAHGVARLTRDIDATVKGEGTELEALVDLDRVRGLVSEICAALDDSARAAEFEDLVKRT